MPYSIGGMFGTSVFTEDELAAIIDVVPDLPKVLVMKLSPMDYRFSDLERQVREETGHSVKFDWSAGDEMSVSFHVTDLTKKKLLSGISWIVTFFMRAMRIIEKCFILRSCVGLCIMKLVGVVGLSLLLRE